MKYSKIFSLFLLLLSFNLFAQVTHTVNFSLNELTISEVTGEDSAIYTKVGYSELQSYEESGKPELPVRYISLIIPYDQEVSQINLNLSGQDTINVSQLIYPSQPPIPTLLGFGGNDFVEPDPLIYGSQNPYPLELVKTSADGYFDGVNHILTLAVYPLQYYPRLNKLIFSSNIQITLEMQRVSLPSLNVNTRTPSVQVMYDNMLTSIIDNPEDISAYKGSYSFQRTDYAPGTYEYIIITTDALKDYFDDFINWKRRKGITIGIVTVEYILSHYTGDLISGIYDDAGKIRQYLKGAYENGTVWA